MWKRAALLLALLCPLTAQKRPLTQDDYDGWRHIQNQTLSNDGRYLAYALFPQQGDGELVVRDLKTGQELRQPVGELPPPPPPDYAHPEREDTPPLPPGVAVKFTPDSRFLVSSTFPSRAAVEQAKREQRTKEDMPKGDLVVLNLTSGAVFRAGRIKDFQLPTQSSGYLAYLQLPSEPRPSGSALHESSQPSAPKKQKLETRNLVLRNLQTGIERKFSGVSEYTLTNDAGNLVYAYVDPSGATSGIYALEPGAASQPVALLAGKGKYNQLAFDEDQQRLAFLSDRDDAASGKPEFKLYSWDRRSPAATELVSSRLAGFPAGWTISDRSKLLVAKGGSRIFFGTAPRPPAPPSSPSLPEDERVSVDLWSWKDDFIQPMQKIRARVERFRSYQAVYDLGDKKFTQLADESMNELLPSDDGVYAIGNDNRLYRRLEEYDSNYLDSYLVTTATGERKLLAQKHVNRLAWSPVSRYAIYFNGKDWVAISTADARVINLTAKLGVSFANEQNDTPGFAESYRLAGWTRDGRLVLIYDRYDIWQCSPDGSSVPLQAILYKPENFDPNRKYPLLVYIYERLTQSVNNFIEPRPFNVINASLYVSNGYLVLEPDIVYKVGYPGQSALNCVLPAVQAVVNRGFVDEAAIGIQGHSWGGYQIAYLITRTNRFRAAAAGAPVADMISAYDGIRWGPGIPRQFQYERTQSRIGGSVWQYPLRYIENSPIFNGGPRQHAPPHDSQRCR